MTSSWWVDAMTAKDYLTLFISTLAFLVALYGVFERQSQTRKQTRIRVSELIDDLLELDVEESKPTEYREEQLKSGWATQLNSRREVLCSMVEALLENLPKGVTEREYSAIAGSLARLRDEDGASRYWSLAAKSARKGTVYEIFVTRGSAQFTFAKGEYDRGRKLYEHALELAKGSADRAKALRMETYFYWSRSQYGFGTDSNNDSEVQELVERAFDEARSISSPALRSRYLYELDLRTKDMRPGHESVRVEDDAHAQPLD